MPVSEPASALEAQVLRALDTVQDPELRRPITELGMLKDVRLDAEGGVVVDVLLTIAGCPLRETITADVERALAAVPGVNTVGVNLDVMTPEQRNALKDRLRGGDPVRTIPFNRPDSLTRVYAVASGKGGVGKSSVTVNLAAAMASLGLRVGIVDADVHGFSVPGLLGITRPPTRVDEMILPPVAYGIKTISIGMFVDGNQPVAWRGPMLHRALEQFLTDVYFGDLDVLFLDLPPGTGDIAISVGQLLPGSEILLVTTPQSAAADVAERAGSVARQTGQKVAGVIENMSWLALPGGERLEIFGSGGGAAVSGRLGDTLGYPVPLLGSIPLDVALREGGDGGLPVVLADAAATVADTGAVSAADGGVGAEGTIREDAETAAAELRRIARELAHRPRGLAGRSLGVSPV
ncbi:Mrp/NBP35 family ATP-binding protein [Arthrobacter sp. zg-Y826]|uniref:Mrp/NBP35 family ATP-binding protein n=1 Tax=Arthrobacter jinronghuae TaxID=2964609 RepID=UPI002102097C|nr:Mrp/NBP35 family ATP-binding protein [Arthrobacter jinronghuae]MCQ1955151.1 Mrp/NBP35 family ATP-binding protein [Arthrobacter jinronghuae]